MSDWRLRRLTEIRNDIFPRIAPFIGNKEEFLKRYGEEFLEQYRERHRVKVLGEYIDEVYNSMSSQFSSKDELIDYINSLKNAAAAELFIKICKFYLISKNQATSYVKLITMISAIEKTISKHKKYRV